MRLSKLFLLILTAGFFIASSGGRNDNRAGAPGDLGTCQSCHQGAATSNGSIELVNLPAVFEPGTTYDFQIRVNEPDAGPALSASGFQLVATDGNSNQMRGEFTVVDNGTRVNFSNRLVQNSPRPFANNAAVWDVQYTTPNNPAQFSDIIFYYSGNSVDETGGTANDVAYFSSNLIVLPVEWVTVEVEDKRGDSYITWSTANELNTSHFEIERSTNGKTFDKIGEVLGQGISSDLVEYEFIDYKSAKGVTYYRIKQVDLDGRHEYSKIISISREIDDSVVRLYPTQVVSDFYVESSAEVNVVIYDAVGNMVRKVNNATTVDISSQLAGMYYVSILNSDGSLIETKKILKI